jgi:mono/diheme cytochrome c family protein
MNKIFALLIIGILYACSQATNVSTVPTEVKKVVSAEELAKGKALYAANCVKCHKIFAPSDFTAKKWNQEVPEMAVKAKIDAETERLILAYVLNGAAN